MEPDGIDTPLVPSGTFLGWELYRDHAVSWTMRGRWRVLWHNPRYAENWCIDGVFNADVWQVGIGPLVLVYVRSENY